MDRLHACRGSEKVECFHYRLAQKKLPKAIFSTIFIRSQNFLNQWKAELILNKNVNFHRDRIKNNDIRESESQIAEIGQKSSKKFLFAPQSKTHRAMREN